MPFLWASIAGILTFVILVSNFSHPILVTNILLGLIVGALFEMIDSKRKNWKYFVLI